MLRYLVAGLALAAAVALAGAPSSSGAAPADPARADMVSGPHLRPDGHIALAWFFGGTSADYRAQIEQMTGLTVVSPTWWYLDRDDLGALEIATDDELVTWSQARGLAVWPLLANHFDPELTDQVLGDAAIRQRLVDNVVAEVRRSGVDGVNVDFENLNDDARFLLTDLVAELKAALPDLVISVDVTAITDTWVLDNWSTAFDREGLGQVADYVVLMAYDQHNALRRDGPVAGLQWVEESTSYLLRTVPAHQVVLGLPLYSRDWAEDADARDGIALDSTLGMSAMAARMADRSESVTYDPIAGQDLHRYIDDSGRPHRVWLEDVASLERKTELVRTYGLAGIAAWRAGFEQPEVWTALDAQLATMPAPVDATEGDQGEAASDDELASEGPAGDLQAGGVYDPAIVEEPANGDAPPSGGEPAAAGGVDEDLSDAETPVVDATARPAPDGALLGSVSNGSRSALLAVAAVLLLVVASAVLLVVSRRRRR